MRPNSKMTTGVWQIRPLVIIIMRTPRRIRGSLTTRWSLDQRTMEKPETLAIQPSLQMMVTRMGGQLFSNSLRMYPVVWRMRPRVVIMIE